MYGTETVAAKFGGIWVMRPKVIERKFVVTCQITFGEDKQKRILPYFFLVG